MDYDEMSILEIRRRHQSGHFFMNGPGRTTNRVDLPYPTLYDRRDYLAVELWESPLTGACHDNIARRHMTMGLAVPFQDADFETSLCEPNFKSSLNRVDKYFCQFGNSVLMEDGQKTLQTGVYQRCFEGGTEGQWIDGVYQGLVTTPDRSDEVDGPKGGSVKIYDLMADIGEVACQNTGPLGCTRGPVRSQCEQPLVVVDGFCVVEYQDMLDSTLGRTGFRKANNYQGLAHEEWDNSQVKSTRTAQTPSKGRNHDAGCRIVDKEHWIHGH
jgi:hypothetical protein